MNVLEIFGIAFIIQLSIIALLFTINFITSLKGTNKEIDTLTKMEDHLKKMKEAKGEKPAQAEELKSNEVLLDLKPGENMDDKVKAYLKQMEDYIKTGEIKRT
jgi:hypothetical protein